MASQSKQKRYVAKPITGGWQIWNRKTKRHWGNPTKVYPEKILTELNGLNRQEELIKLVNYYRNNND